MRCRRVFFPPGRATRARAFLTSLRGWHLKTQPMRRSCLCVPCSPSCAEATQRNSSPRNISFRAKSGWRKTSSSTRSSLRGGKRCFRRSRRCLPRGKRGFPRRLPAPARCARRSWRPPCAQPSKNTCNSTARCTRKRPFTFTSATNGRRCSQSSCRPRSSARTI